MIDLKSLWTRVKRLEMTRLEMTIEESSEEYLTELAARLRASGNRVKTPEDLKAMGVELKWLNSGGFREVYKIRGYDGIVKFPIEDEDASLDQSISHSSQEIKTISNLKRLKPYKWLRPYLPKIYYGNTKTGVILMKYYSRKVPQTNIGLVSVVISLVQAVWPFANKSGSQCDLSFENIRLTDEGLPVIIDLGYFGKEGGAW